MASYQIKVALLSLALVVAFMAAAAIYAFSAVCQMSLALQEWVAVQGTPIVTMVKFGKCRHK